MVFEHFCLKLGMVIGGTFTKTYSTFQQPGRVTGEKEREIEKIYHTSWILPIHASLLRWLPFSTDAYAILNHVQGQVWKRVWIFEARSENGFGKWHFLVWNWVWIWRCGWHTPTKNCKCCENFGRFHRRKFKKITNKVIKTAKNTLIWALII